VCASYEHLWSNRHLRQAAKRWATYKESPPHKQHIWFLPTRKPTLKKPKELFFANALTEIESINDIRTIY
jgi:hypothetical protein